MKISGKVVDIHNRSIYSALIIVEDGIIHEISEVQSSPDVYILPGLIDAHIHIESSMVTPAAFAEEAVRHGTVAVISDPHEIANVCGVKGVDFMIENGEKVPVRFYFGAPSCVPATGFETSGAVMDKNIVRELLSRNEIHYMSEMMNYPGVISNDFEVISKISYAKEFKKQIDGHAPELTGINLQKYVTAGISTDHECSSVSEALEKISLGMKILIREGSAAKNMDGLKELYKLCPEYLMLCSDDLHPEMLMRGHINKLVARLITDGYDPFDVIRSATLNPMIHYSIESGLLRKGDRADLILVEDLTSMEVIETWINGEKVFDRGNVSFIADRSIEINNFNCSYISFEDIRIVNEGVNMRIIEAFDGDIITREIIDSSGSELNLRSDTDRDYLKIIVKDRYNDSPPVSGFIKGFRLKKGAFASSVAHDSHNIICVGTDDSDIISAINRIVDMKGGLSVACGNEIFSLKLNIGGIMTSDSCRDTARDYEYLSDKVRNMGCTMSAPFMTLAFMALLVIPDLKIGDKGLFDVNRFSLVPLFIE